MWAAKNEAIFPPVRSAGGERIIGFGTRRRVRTDGHGDEVADDGSLGADEHRYPAAGRCAGGDLEVYLIDSGAAGGSSAIGDGSGDASDEDFGFGGKIAWGGSGVIGAEGGSESDAVKDFGLSDGGGGRESIEGDCGGRVILNTAGPLPGSGGGEIPTLEATTLTVAALLRKLLWLTRRVTSPRGVLDGMMALIWPELKKTGMAATVVVAPVLETCVNGDGDAGESRRERELERREGGGS